MRCTPADVVLLILDATAGVTEQDRVLSQKVSDDGRTCVIVCNKWYVALDKDLFMYNMSMKYFWEVLLQVQWDPIIFMLAATGQWCRELCNTVDLDVSAHRRRISTSVLNEVLRNAILW